MRPFSSRNLTFKTCIFASVLFIICLRRAQGDSDVINTVFSGYDKVLRPDYEKGTPTVVNCSLLIESFGNIEEADMEYRVYAYFHLTWKDPRLSGKVNRTLNLKGDQITNIWVPDPYCYNARESNMMSPDEETHSNLKIEPDGEIYYSRGVSLLASCTMDLKYFPLDSQMCFLKFGSYGNTVEDIIFKWMPGKTNIAVVHEELAQFKYMGSSLESGVTVLSTGNFSTITAKFSFERRIGYYLIQVYFPDIFVVVLSWIVFWMEKDDIGNRMALGITTILTIMFLLGSLNGNLPKVSYPKALDWYLLFSFSFVFLSLIESTVVFLFAVKANKNEKIKCKKHTIPITTRIASSMKCFVSSKSANVNNANDDYKGVSENDLEMGYRPSKADKALVDDAEAEVPHNRSTKITRMEKNASNIDRVSRVLFPLVFLVFNLFYWTFFNGHVVKQ